MILLCKIALLNFSFSYLTTVLMEDSLVNKVVWEGMSYDQHPLGKELK